MNFLPVIERELRARARSRATFWMRFGVVLVGVTICLPELLSGGFGTQAGNSGKFIFNGIVVIAFLLACGGCLLTADLISRERREGTLGLLLLTRVRGFDVLMGKFGSAGLTSICGLAALLPLMMIPVLAGGVTGGEAFRKGLAILNTLFLALAAGLWASAVAKEQARAVGRTVRVLAALILVPLVLTIFEPLRLWLVGPISTLFVADDQAYKRSAAPYWVSLGLVHLIAWAHLIGASRRLRSATLETDEKAPARFTGDEYYQSLKRKWPLSWTGKPQGPIEFLVKRQRGVNAIIWTAALTGLFFQFGAAILFRFGTFFLSRWFPMAAIGGALFAWAISRFAIESRRSGALELLLTTPLGAQKIITGQWDAWKQLLRWPVLLLLLPLIYQVVIIAAFTGPMAVVRRVQWTFISFSLVNTLAGLAALCWTGLWFGIKARSQAAAILWTVAIAKGVPYLLGLISQGLFAVGIFPAYGATVYEVRWYIPSFLTLLFYVRLMFWARARLLVELSGSEPLRFSVRRTVSRETVLAAIQTAREWKTH